MGHTAQLNFGELGGADIDFGRPDGQDTSVYVAYNVWSSAITTAKKPRYIAITFNRANIGDGSVWIADTKHETAKTIGYNGGFRFSDVTYSDVVQFVSDTSFKIRGQASGDTFNYQVVWWYE